MTGRVQVKFGRVLVASAALAAAGVGSAVAESKISKVHDPVFAATMSQARDNAAANRQMALAFTGADAQNASLVLLADNTATEPTAFSAEATALDASTGAPIDVAQVRRDLAARGKANERVAMRAKGEAGWRDAPRSDEKGYYFSYDQTRAYSGNAQANRLGIYSAAYYEALRCRATFRVGPLSGNPSWRGWNWRVCPDEQGRYRLTL